MISLILNVALDPLLMFGWLGFPRLGLNGTAVATIVAQAVAFGSIALYVQRCKHVAAPDWRRLRLDGPTTLLTLKLGIPSMLQQALVSLGFIVFVGLVNGFGTHSAAAYGIASRIDQLAFMPAMAIGMAISTLAGQNIGAGRLDRVRESLWWGMAISCSITLVGCFAAFVIPEFLMRLFSHDADVVATGAGYLRIVAWGYLMFAVMFASNGVVNGAGHTFATTLFTFIAFWLVRIPLAIYLAHHWGRVEGLWVAHVCGLAAGTITSLAYYFSGLWKKTTIRRRVPATGVVSE
jgi:putative MATE family efflux protein